MQIFLISKTFKLFSFIAIIAKLKSIRSPIKSFVILADVFTLSFWPIPDDKKDKNIAVFDLLSENDNLFYDEVLLVCRQIDEDCIVTKI